MLSYLLAEVDHCHTLLWERLERASSRRRRLSAPGAVRMQTDGFLAPASQHLAAVVEVLLPEVSRTLDDGRQRARGFARDCKHLEFALAKAKAKQYGQSQAVGCSWSDVWSEVRVAFGTVADSERELIELLAVRLGPAGEAALCTRFRESLERSGTRPHPHLPHLSPAGRALRRVCSRLDRLWDEIEGRVIPPTQQPAATAGRTVEVGVPVPRPQPAGAVAHS